MYKSLTVAVVVPAHNEEQLVAKTVSRMPGIVDHIIVVDDASSDGTGEAAKSVGTAAPRSSLSWRTRESAARS